MKSYISKSGSETVDPALATLQFSQIVLTSAFSIPLPARGSTQHFTAACKIFYTGPLLMKEIRVTEWKRKSAWRIENFHLLSISYSNAAIML